MTWRDQAACAGTPIEWWFPSDSNGQAMPNHVPAQAAERCAACPVRRQCARHALRHEEWGVFAEMSENERRRQRITLGINVSGVPEETAQYARIRRRMENAS